MSVSKTENETISKIPLENTYVVSILNRSEGHEFVELFYVPLESVGQIIAKFTTDELKDKFTLVSINRVDAMEMDTIEVKYGEGRVRYYLNDVLSDIWDEVRSIDGVEYVGKSSTFL